ncbi:MDR family oxidoreductase [Alicyclobacillus sp. SO9]|uniref:MDR family oxidoreductase n=1 Tax=Alicyclobacillus sp. SO9 TaxID=2665646 RepID=UPI0018E7DCBF|nr:MDR family oxidoreductase [Alicyclobacillus sp. SO9]QQE77686.1 oxidoreductase [Alicyclobacillus sp. SO9]
MQPDFSAVLLTQSENGRVTADVKRIPSEDLPKGDVLVSIAYSDLNYKDGLALTGKNKVVRKYPMIPGIDFAGTVEESQSPNWYPGDEVILTGWGVGERHWGGYSELARVSSQWLVPLPGGMTHRDAMAYGTAGLTAMLSVMALEQRRIAKELPVVVTGASGGVGSVAVALLAANGYEVYASTGRQEESDFLKALGAAEVIGRFDAPTRPLESERWAGAVDTVGGDTLAALLAGTTYGGTVAACGLAGGITLPTSVFPFILRGVGLQGIDSVMCPIETRKEAWKRLHDEMPQTVLERLTSEISLTEVLTVGPSILDGTVRGRTVIRVK